MHTHTQAARVLIEETAKAAAKAASKAAGDGAVDESEPAVVDDQANDEF